MDQRALRERIRELEGVQNPTAEQQGELKQLHRRLARLTEDGPQRTCEHPNVKCGDRFCRNCGAEINMPPREAIAQVVRDVLEDEYQIIDNENSNSSNRDDADLHAQWEAYCKKNEPPSIKSAGDSGPLGFNDFKSFERATPAERKQALERLSVTDREIEEAKKAAKRAKIRSGPLSSRAGHQRVIAL